MGLSLLAALLSLAAGLQDAPPSTEKIRAWVDQLGALYESERAEARKQLVAAGKAAEKPLARGLEHADHRVRKGCLELLASLNSALGVERASGIFRSKEEDRSVQAAAFEYLKPHGALAEDVFIEALDNAEETYRMGALDVLTGLKSSKALPKAAALFDRDSSKSVRDRIFSLMRTGGDPARPYLVKLLGNPDAGVRQEALSALIDLKTPAEDLIEPVTKLLKMEVTSGILEAAFDVFSRAGDKAIPHLLEGLRSPTQAVRRKALDAVKAQRTEGALGGVAELYHRETEDDIRKVALAYLIEQGLRAEPALIKALESPIAKVRMEAIPALGMIKSEKVFDRVALLYKNEKDAEVRRACFAYLETVGLRAEEELLAATKDDDLSIRQRAIRALGQAGSVKAIAPLAEILKDDKSPVRADALEALASIGDKAVEHLLEGVKAQRVREKDANDVIALVNQVSVEKILDAMISEDGSTGTWPGQFEGLAKLGRERVMPVLWKMATESDYAIKSRDATKLPGRYATYLQCLALLAIGELGDAAALKRLQTFNFPENDDRLREHLVAMHRLGDKARLEAFVASELKEGRGLFSGEERLAGYGKVFNAAILQSRVGMKEEALKTYLELTQAVENARMQSDYQDTPSAYYNIACLHAAAGRKAEAVAALARAIETGFKDYDWIFKDRELDPIRGEEGYKKLTAEAEKARKK
ncbi:MAG TPA: HEAT repeat domain-containing protein [Planctomycetota bacterium]|nr:HEAT repeat domain-containing protein [Planctomycetota bacterium]